MPAGEKPPTRPRKLPRQGRSRATVEVILDAAARVLVERGFERMTTNHVARVAGVSIGSLYQYFPNKDSLVRALLERHVAEAEAMRPAELRRPDLPLRRRIRLAVEWHLAAHASNPRLHQELSALGPRIVGDRAIRSFERGVERTIRVVLEAYRDELRPRDLDVAAFVVAQSIESLTHAAVLHHPELLDDPRLVDELTRLIVGYLAALPPPDGGSISPPRAPSAPARARTPPETRS
ncbi:MAG: TetR/AcrR family transcriptional regulator [Candidatus Binatia bacterium]